MEICHLLNTTYSDVEWIPGDQMLVPNLVNCFKQGILYNNQYII